LLALLDHENQVVINGVDPIYRASVLSEDALETRLPTQFILVADDGNIYEFSIDNPHLNRDGPHVAHIGVRNTTTGDTKHYLIDMNMLPTVRDVARLNP